MTSVILSVLHLPALTLAYLDGGTGSLLLQSALAGALTAGYVVRTQWHALKVRFARKDRSAADAAVSRRPDAK